MEIKTIINRRIIIIVAIVAIAVLILGIIIYLILVKNKYAGNASGNKNNSNQQVIPTEPISQVEEKNKEAEKITEKDVYFPILSEDKKYIIFNSIKDGVFYKLDLATRKEVAISDPIFFMEDIIWSPNWMKAILKIKQDQRFMNQYKSPFLDKEVKNGSLSFWIYNFETKNFKRLNRNVQDIRWVDNNRIVYSYMDSDNNSIAIADPETDRWELLKDTKDYPEGVGIETDGISVYYYPRTTEIGGSSLFKINIADKKEGTVIDKYEVVSLTFSPSKNKIIYEAWNDNTQKTSIGLANQKDGSRVNTGVVINSGLKDILFSEKEDFILFPSPKENQTTINKLIVTEKEAKPIKEIYSGEIKLLGLIDDKILYFYDNYFLYKVGI